MQTRCPNLESTSSRGRVDNDDSPRGRSEIGNVKASVRVSFRMFPSGPVRSPVREPRCGLPDVPDSVHQSRYLICCDYGCTSVPLLSFAILLLMQMTTAIATTIRRQLCVRTRSRYSGLLHGRLSSVRWRFLLFWHSKWETGMCGGEQESSSAKTAGIPYRGRMGAHQGFAIQWKGTD